MIVTTTPAVEGRKIVAYKGIVFGEVVSGVNFIKDMFSSITDMIGGRSGTYEKELQEAREKALAEIVDEARSRWPLGRVTVIHRIGELWPGDEIVFVGVTSAHRSSAFDAGQFIMDYLKTRAPFWKREATPEGERWVDARDSDKQAAKRW